MIHACTVNLLIYQWSLWLSHSVMCLLLISSVSDDPDSIKRTTRVMRYEKSQGIHLVPMYTKLLSSNSYEMWVIHVLVPSPYVRSTFTLRNPI